MKMRNFSKYLMLLSAAVLGLASCSSDDEDETLYLDGTIKLSMPAYVAPGYSKSFQVDTLTSLSRPDGEAIGYYFRCTSFAVLDTVKKVTETSAREFTFTVPDSLGTFSLTVSGFSPDYSSSTASVSFTTIKVGRGEGTSVTDYDLKEEEDVFEDPRDGQQYYLTKVGDTWWMRDNLAWAGAGKPFKYCDIMSSVFGRYYTWEEAQTACPEGWRLPKESDWMNLVRSVGATAQDYSTVYDVAGHLMENVKFNGSEMWPFARYVRIKNSARFSAMPVGYILFAGDDQQFEGFDEYAVFWSGEEAGEGGACRYIYKEQDYLYYGSRDKTSFGASVRCVRD